MLADPALEARAREVGEELRCLVCRNQSIDDSDADLAHDLRVLVRERITAGDSNEQIIAYVRSRYGDFVLLRPPFAIGTAAAVGRAGADPVARRRSRSRGFTGPPRDAAPPPPLSAEERRRLAAVLGEEAAMSLGLADRADRADLAGVGAPAGAAACCAGTARGSREAYNLAVYRDQLAEIERDLARGVLTAEQAEAARAEIGRRILALGPRRTAPLPVRRDAVAAAIVAVLLCRSRRGCSTPRLGSPALPDQPFAERAQRRADSHGRAGAAARHAEALGKLRRICRASRRSDRLAAAGPLRAEPRRITGGRRRLPPCRRSVRPSPRHHGRLGRGAGAGRRRHGDAGGARGVRGGAAGPGERAALALLPGARADATGRREGRAARLGRSRGRFAGRCRMAAAVATAHRRSRAARARPGDGEAVRCARAAAAAPPSATPIAGGVRHAVAAGGRSGREGDRRRSAGRAPRDDRARWSSASPRASNSSPTMSKAGRGSAAPTWCCSGPKGARRLRPCGEAEAGRPSAAAGIGRGDSGSGSRRAWGSLSRADRNWSRCRRTARSSRRRNSPRRGA